MKKTVALMMLLVFFALACTPLIHAVEESETIGLLSETVSPENGQESEQNYVTLRENSVIYTCRYHSDLKTVEISGTVNHDVMITHSDYFIAVYRLALGKTVDEIFEQEESEALATTAIAVKFQFSFDAEKVSDRFARYAITLCSSEGEVILAAEPQYAAVESTFQYSSGDRSGFKGIGTERLSVGGSLNAGSAIVEVSLDRLLSRTSSGYMYQVGDSYQYFDKTYIDRLDASVRTYSAGGCRVYLQFLFSESDPSDAESPLEALYSEEILSFLSACSEFLVSRYDSYRNGRICGIIVGDPIDRMYEERYSSYTVREYAERYAFLLTVVANSARVYQSDLDMLLPFSDRNDYEKQSESDQTNASGAFILETVLNMLEERLSYDFPCGTLIESKASVEHIMEPFSKQDESKTEASDTDEIGLATIGVYSAYLARLSEQYANAPDHFMFVWKVPADCRGNSLACAYAYSYYRLFSESMISSFVVSFAEAEVMETDSILDIQKIIRYIDTEQSFDVTENLLTYFGAKRWGEVLSLPAESELWIRSFERAGTFDIEALDWKGSFSYAEFPQGNMSGWYAGAFCGEIKSDYSKDGERILNAALQPKNTVEPAEVLYLYEYSENFVYTPYLVLDLFVSDGGASSDRLCEVSITLGNQRSTIMAEYIVSVNRRTLLTLDIGAYANESVVDYIKISARVLSEEPSACNLLLYDLVGYSTVYSSEELNTLIEEERARIRNQQDMSDDDSSGRGLTWIIFGILLAVSAVGVGLFVFFRKTEENRERETDVDQASDKNGTSSE